MSPQADAVDVVAYLRREVEKGKYARPHIVARRQAVHDAVAELIEADREFDAAAQAVCLHEFENRPGRHPVYARMAAARGRRAAALAAVTPAAPKEPT